MQIDARNVNDALARAVRYVVRELNYLGTDSCDIVEQPSRNGVTLEALEPVLTIYERPCERVLFSHERDANPFFHLFEALWMLAGRRDVAFVSAMVKRMREFSDDGETFNGAYGHRWRRHFGYDQLDRVIEELRTTPSSRRVVLSMWGSSDLGKQSKDLPCNTHAYFKVRDRELRMTVCCRSNDVIWGAYGANAVHFSVLQEYVAGRLGVAVGPMYQLSDSWHIYTGGAGGAVWQRLRDSQLFSADPYVTGAVAPTSLGVDAFDDTWDHELRRFFGLIDSGAQGQIDRETFAHPWWRDVVVPMWRAWYHRDVFELNNCVASDWRRAGCEWLARRGQGVAR